MARLFWAFTLLAGILIGLGVFTPVGTTAVTAPALAASHDSLDGEKIFMAQKCNLCHGVEAAGIAATTKSDKVKGPDLSEVTEHRKDEWLADYLRKEEAIDGKQHAKAFTGSDEELGAVIAWLHEVAQED